MMTFYKAVVRPVTEYACQVWHPGLSKAQHHKLEQIQRRALRIIFQETPYELALSSADTTTLEERRDNICKQMFLKMGHDSNKLNSWLVNRPKPSCNIRHFRQYHVPLLKNERYKKDFIIYSLVNFQ